MWLKQAIVYKKAALTERVEAPLSQLADSIASNWADHDTLDRRLSDAIDSIPDCHLLYVLDTNGSQISSNVFEHRIDIASRGQRLSDRPFHTGNLPYRGMVLSSVYLSRVTHKRCITAIHAVTLGEQLLGFVAADFNLEDVPLPDLAPESSTQWTQYKGDPVIRSHVFEQKRMASFLDEHFDEVIGNIDGLMREHGIYHVIIHFSSSRAIFWVYDDPYKYRFHSAREILDSEIWLAYPPHAYPTEARVAPEQIGEVLKQFRNLRVGDENIYLRSGSLNIMNGIIGLTFSCDGSHYLTVDEFLNRDHPFWV